MFTVHKHEHTDKLRKGFTPCAVATRSLSPNEDMKTFIWWSLLCLLSVFNISLWLWTYSTFTSSPTKHASMNNYQRNQVVLSGIYVLVCTYRSIFPRIDLERYCLFDKQLSSIFFGRWSATIAEISFAAQFALFLYELGQEYNHPICQKFALALVPIIAVAQMFCWFGVLSLNHVYHAIEESIWAIIGAFIGIHFLNFAIYHPNNERLFILGLVGCVFSFLFFAFMVTVDVPMYISRWNDGKQTGRKHMIMRNGCADAWSRRVVTWDWNVWKEEVMWLTGYFSSAVWISLTLVHMPTK